MEQANTVYFMLHVPKCAGSTAIGHIEHHLGPAAQQAPRWSSPMRNFVGNRSPFKPNDPRLTGVRVLYGHALSQHFKSAFPDAEIKEAVTLRDPVGYFISLYNFRAGRAQRGAGPVDPPFERWYPAQRKNPISRFILYRYFGWPPPRLFAPTRSRLAWLEQRLSRFWFVGSYRRVNELVNGMAEELGIPGDPAHLNSDPTKKIHANDVPEDLKRLIQEDNLLDDVLFRRWSDRGFDAGRDPVEPAKELPTADVGKQLYLEVRNSIRMARIRAAR